MVGLKPDRLTLAQIEEANDLLIEKHREHLRSWLSTRIHPSSIAARKQREKFRSILRGEAMKPTKELLRDHADAWEAAASVQRNDSAASVIAYALRLAANMPSEMEIADALYSHENAKCDYINIGDAARAVLALIEGEK